MLPRISTRASSTCTKFHPLNENYKRLRHIHFPGITPFAKGEAIQQKMVAANLDFKKMEAKIRKQSKDLMNQGFALSDYENKFLNQVLSMKPFPTILTFEFDNVYTGGKQMKQNPQLAQNIKEYEALGCQYHQLERGGQVTWHGNGQLTAYLILDLKQFTHLTVKCFVDAVLLRGVQNMLQKNYGLQSYVNENPGVWMAPNDKKIASVGCNIQRAITSYGVGVNIDPDMKFLNTYTMCGLPGTRATSLKEMRPDVSVSVKEAGDLFAKEVAKLLNITTIEHMNGQDLLEGETENQAAKEDHAA
ncbi:lipoyl(octanoyl) transferase [Candidozyma auris]|uniref:lipoyl(octanoyl) transferase LIP2 n=1 Tax=Candidozyma auris TaxID=498019 RepID=UPI000C5307D9|nr:lipoyl(octanoyl)_transferase [[Candida] auris]PIS57580.1 lipoyl(octanoyl) transferase [[Candida] auris]QEO22601.1 lipoyl(octanoyl)_transferase [[Candida] auris]GBL50990.1 putative lipoyl(octanoyl) transferase [[Candida] auris]